MGHGMDGGMVNPFAQNTIEERLECELLCCLIRQAGSVIGNEKPSSIFNFVPRRWGINVSHDMLLEVACLASEVYCEKLRDSDMKLIELAVFDNRIAMFSYRKSLIEDILKDESNQRFLQSYGYDTSSVESTIKSLKTKLRAFYIAKGDCVFRDEDFDLMCQSNSFPHEIGVLLGYPLQDVVSFIENEGKDSKALGSWKAYTNVEAAKKRFQEIKTCERNCMSMFESGYSLRDLLKLNGAY